MPIYTDEYNLLSNNTYIDDVNNIALGKTSVVSDSAANDISGFYQKKLNEFNFVSSNIKNCIDQKLNFKFPVIAKINSGNIVIIKSKTDDNYSVYNFTSVSEENDVKLENITSVFDTYDYLIDISQKMSIDDKLEFNNKFFDKISFAVPNGYTKII